MPDMHRTEADLDRQADIAQAYAKKFIEYACEHTEADLDGTAVALAIVFCRLLEKSDCPYRPYYIFFESIAATFDGVSPDEFRASECLDDAYRKAFDATLRSLA